MRNAVFLILIAIAGCGSPSGPSTTETFSSSIALLPDRIQFLEKYVTFRRSYSQLDFHTSFHNNSGGMIPGPSDYDVRMVAVVPAAEIAQWIPADVKAVPATDNSWLANVPGVDRAKGITEWYVELGKVVGVDRANSVIAYRIWKH